MRNLMETNQTTGTGSANTNCNATIDNMESLQTPMGMLLQIELLAIFTAFLLLFLAIFGSWRRRCNNKTFRLVIFTAYTLSTYVLTYALGLMHDAPLRNELFPVWAMFLMVALGSADSISAYSLEDNEQWKSYNWQLVIKSIWLFLLIDLYFRDRSNEMKATECLFLVLAVKYDERAQALLAASRQSLERNSKVVADYMSREHESGGASSGEVDPVTMTGYTYLVRGEEERWVNTFVRAKRFIKRWCLGKKKAAPERDYRMPLKKDKLITIEKVWKCEEGLLSSQGGDPHNELKDICLSFALFKLLRLRYAGYPLPQQAHENARKLIHDGLLSQIHDEFLPHEDDYKRAFRVVEVELTFLFDYFYTKYGIIFRPGRLLIKLMEFMSVVMGIWATISLLKDYKRLNNNCQLVTMPNGLSVDELVTSLMIISFIIMELMQFIFMGFSEWTKVILICKYVQNKSWQGNLQIERMIRAICRVHLLKPWERKLHQYSFLKSYSYKPSRLLNNESLAAYIDQTRDGQRQSSPIKLPKEVKQAVFHALKFKSNTKLENGQASLRENNVFEKLSWACLPKTQTQVIMVWHIATSFCEHQPLVRSDSSISSNFPQSRNFLVAISLSKYLAYLLVFAPRLLPDHPYVAEYVFDRVVIEARYFFEGCKNLKDRVTRMKRMGSDNSMLDKKIIEQGVELGNQLVNDVKDNKMIWKILVDFWVELLLYVAPSDDTKAHVEHLAKGGEFVTHLWALISHAGIQRDHSSV